MSILYLILIAGVVFIIMRQLRIHGKITPLAGYAAMGLFLVFILITAIDNGSISAEFIALFGISFGLLGNLAYREYSGSDSKANTKAETEAAG